jgi:hypothetical protein
VGFVIKDQIDSNKRSLYTSRPSTSATTSASYSSSMAEKRPPVGTGKIFTTNQVRYCVYQGARLDYLRGTVSGSTEISRFNFHVEDFNSRCSNYKYRRGVLKRIRSELAGNRAEVLNKAYHLVQ